MNCRNCGTEIKNQNKFCPKCGRKIEELSVITTPVVNNFPHDISNVWPEWQIEKQLGKGSYGVVYQAIRRDNNVESRSAIKVISIPSDISEVDSLRSEGLDIDGTKTYFKGIVDDFVSEIQLMESLKGVQNIVSVEDYKVIEKNNSIGWNIYIRMELLTSFNEHLSDKSLSEKDIVNLGCDICSALEICEQRNIIHRDIKPENIFVNDFGHYKLGDFGIARKLENLTGGLSQKGTYNYMAPEVANCSKYDVRADIYSLGIVLYRLLNNNKLPFLDTDKQILSPNERRLAVEKRMAGEALPAPCNASLPMANLILRACAHDPNTRFSSATDMKDALVRIANDSMVNTDTNLNKTTSVRRAKPSNEQNAKHAIDSFGHKPTNKSKSKKAMAITLSILTFFLTLVIIFTVLFFTGTPYKIYKNMQSQDYEDVVSEYNDEIKDRFINNFIFKKLLQGEVENASKNYNSGEWNYNTTKTHLEVLSSMDFEDAKKTLENITLIEDSKIALEKGFEYYEQGEYENAITELSKIPENSPNYEDAQTKLHQSYISYIDATVITINEYSSQAKYKEAILYANTAYTILPYDVDTAKIDIAKETALSAYKIKISEEVTTLTSESKYLEAIKVINEAISFEDNEYFQTLKATTESNYIAYISGIVSEFERNENYSSAIKTIETADALITSNSEFKNKLIALKDSYRNQIISKADSALESTGYEAAIQLIEEGLTILPNDSELLAKITEYEEYKPVSIETLTITASNGYKFSPSQQDPRGELNIDVLYLEKSIEFYTGGKYSKFIATIDPNQYFSRSSADGTLLKIYADDELVYCSPVITYKTDNLQISVDIKNADYIKIVLYAHDGYGFPEDVLIYNAFVFK